MILTGEADLKQDLLQTPDNLDVRLRRSGAGPGPPVIFAGFRSPPEGSGFPVEGVLQRILVKFSNRSLTRIGVVDRQNKPRIHIASRGNGKSNRDGEHHFSNLIHL